MKKNIFALFLAMLATMVVTSCKEDEGTEPGGDSSPVATVYQYSTTAPQNPDNDVRIRVVANSKVQEAYFMVEKTEDYNAKMKEMGKEGYMKYVVEKGTKLDDIKGASDQDFVMVGLLGPNTVSVVAVNGNKKTIASTEFTGLTWTTVASGSYYFDVMKGFFGEDGYPTKLQVCDYDENMYRFENLFGEGHHLKITLLPDYVGANGEGEYIYVRVPDQGIGLEYGSYGEIGVRDVGYWQGNDAFITQSGYNGFFYPESKAVSIMAQWYVSAGNLGYNGYDSFVPDEE
ncbi:MAG: hypothetical protein KBT34_00395 [Prevotella sp.]|nr:hypothetical protein [Candidatus Prevotella equi]